VAEANGTFLAPAELERFPVGRPIHVLEVGVGLGVNTAALIEAAATRGLPLAWWGLERDPRPLALALAEPRFRRGWQPLTLQALEQLHWRGRWATAHGEGRLLWGDARLRVVELLREGRGRFDLVLMDAFSPRRCPELWTVEFLGRLAGLLRADGRLITYCSAAAARRGLQLAGLELAAVPTPDGAAGQWSLGTVASPTPLPASARLRPLTPMELEHLATRAAEPYRDPGGQADSAWILAERQRAQARSGAPSTSAWRRRWGLEPPRAAERMEQGR
jgi:hypothetical protein